MIFSQILELRLKSNIELRVLHYIYDHIENVLYESYPFLIIVVFVGMHGGVISQFRVIHNNIL